MSRDSFSCRQFLLCTLLWACVSLLAGCGTIVEPFGPTTSVVPLATEDLKEACRFEIQFPAPDVPQTGVLVVYERGDSEKLYVDSTVQATAAKLRLATVFAYQCDAKSFDDFQFDAAKGPGRALFQALNQFATLTGHPELANANVVLSGFSAAGYLSLTMANNYPDRILGAILYDPASAYANIQYQPVTPQAAQVPMLILGGDADTAAGTHRPLALFQRVWAQGARWGFGIEPNVGHCCADTVAPLQNAWITGLVNNDTEPNAALGGLATPLPRNGPVVPNVQFACVPDSSFDVFGWQDCTMADASILSTTAATLQPGWLPDTASAQAWLTWVGNQ